MSNTGGLDGEKNQPMIYQIRVQGHLGRQWADRFADFVIRLADDGTTLLIGPVVDQAALHGILRSIRDLGVTLIAVNAIDPDYQDPSRRK